MSFNAKVFRILIASPGDVDKERKHITKALQEWNNKYSEARRIVLLDLKWETHATPYFGDRPQSIINKDVVDKADCLVGVFWTRIGSPTGIDVSGTVEEIKRTHAAKKPVLLYFSKVSVDPELIDIKQLESVRKFKKSLYQEGLVDSYSSLEEFGEKFSRHLEDVVRKLSRETVEEKIDEETASITDAEEIDKIIESENEEIESLFDEADKRRAHSPQSFLLHLKELAKNQSTDEFINEIKINLGRVNLSQNDFLTIEKMCRGLGLMEHRIALLRYALEKYPDSSIMKLALIDAYDDSTDVKYRSEGRNLIEEHLNVKREDGEPVDLSYNPASIEEYGLLFNYYFKDRQYGWALNIARKLLEYGDESALTMRNYARALQELGRIEEAEEAYIKVISRYPDDDSSYSLYGDFLDEQGRFTEAYENTENGVLADPEDPARYINLAIQVLNRGIVRFKDGSLSDSLPRKSRIKYALPFFIKAYELDDGRYFERIISILVRAEAIEEAKALMEKDISSLEYISDPLDYINEKLNQHNE